MYRKLALVMLVSGLAFSSIKLEAQSSPDYPDSILGFLKPGMHVEVVHAEKRSRDSEAYFSLTIFSDSSYQLAVDARELSLDELRKKYAAVEEHAEQTLSNFNEKLAEKEGDLQPGKRYAQPTLSLAVNRRSLFCTVVYVGDDYLLVAYDEPEKRKRVVPKHMIKTIDWDDGLPRLFPHARVVDVDADETEPSGARGFR